MEQTTQQNIQKPSFPIKTKIVAWLIIVISIIVASYVLKFLAIEILSGGNNHQVGIDFLVIFILPPSLIHLFLFAFILKGKIWAWLCGMIILFIEMILACLITFFHVRACIIHDFQINTGYVILPFLFIFPFILLLLDRKNFFKIAS